MNAERSLSLDELDAADDIPALDGARRSGTTVELAAGLARGGVT